MLHGRKLSCMYINVYVNMAMLQVYKNDRTRTFNEVVSIQLIPINLNTEQNKISKKKREKNGQF